MVKKVEATPKLRRLPVRPFAIAVRAAELRGERRRRPAQDADAKLKPQFRPVNQLVEELVHSDEILHDGGLEFIRGEAPERNHHAQGAQVRQDSIEKAGEDFLLAVPLT